jgi:hypothetical protein
MSENDGFLQRVINGIRGGKPETTEPTIEIDDKLIEMIDSPDSVTQIESKPIKEKVALYYKLYDTDELTFQLVNFLVDRITHTFIFEGDVEVVKELEIWKDNINFKTRLEDIVRDIIVGGLGWIELVFGKKTIDRIVVINPESMDFIRDSNGQTALDEDGIPVGFQQETPSGIRYYKKDEVAQGEIKLAIAKGNEDLRDRIKYLKLLGRGDSFTGKSFVGAIYRVAIIRTNVADMTGEAAFRGGGMVATTKGDMNPDQKKKLKVDLKNITARNTMIIKDSITLGLMPIPDTANATEIIYLLADFQSMGMGVPLDIMVSGGRSQQRDLITKIADMETRISSLQVRLAEQINDNIISPLLIKMGKPEKAKLKFVSASPGALLNRSRVVSTLARRNLMTYDPELEVSIRKELDLPHTLLDKVLSDWKSGKAGPEYERKQAEKQFEIQNKANQEQNNIDTKDDQPINDKQAPMVKPKGVPKAGGDQNKDLPAE